MSPAAHLPSVKLPGVNPAWDRYVAVPSTSSVDPKNSTYLWHVLDTHAQASAEAIENVSVTLFCVHGNPTWSYLYRSVLAAANERFPSVRVIAVDQLDMGYSEDTHQDRTLPDRINDLGDLSRALGIDGSPVVTVGHDWGGIISLGWALQHRENLQAVALFNTAVHPAGFQLPPALQLALHPAVHRWGTQDTSAFIDVTLALAQPTLSKDIRAAYKAPYRGRERRRPVRQFVADIPATPAHPSHAKLIEVSEGLRDLTVPAFFQWGPKDPVFSDRYLNDLIDRIPHAQVHRYEGASHMLPEDRDVATPLLEWVEGLRTSRENSQSPVSQEPLRFLSAELENRSEDSSTACADILPDGNVQRVSWADLSTRVDRLAAGLYELGARPGSRVSLLVPPGTELTSVVYACLKIGAIIVVADAGLGTKGMGRAIKGAQPDFLIGIDRALSGARVFGWPGRKIAAAMLPEGVKGTAKRRALNAETDLADLERRGQDAIANGWTPPQLDPDADAAVLFTSGSTGPAKGVVYTHRRLAGLRDTIQQTYGLRAGTGLVAGFAPFALLGPALGAVSVTPDMDVTAPRTLTAKALADAVAAIDATAVFCSPAALENVVATAQGASLPGVELVLSAGAPIPVTLLEKVQTIFPKASLHTPYGMTEALPIADIDLQALRAASSSSKNQANGVCVGTAVSGATIAILPFGTPDAEIAEAALTSEPGVSGEVVVQAPHIKERYDRLALTQAESARIPGWHRTGDVGHYDDAARLWIEGRLQHVVTSASGPITPVAYELAAESVPSVQRAAAVGVGPAGTQALVIAVEVDGAKDGLASAALAAEIRAAIAEHVADPAPVSAVVTTRIPTDIRHNSKVDRTAVAAWATEALSGGKVPRRLPRAGGIRS
ncbi:alpha/beta fold hydrolase [Neomicrococcus lactis]|uniref:alpha/beta fold hydrolase n=1 Tax=Neomicrococcus lactis TaxID=732241 RepID=UPI002301D5FC|nr:alpha/beta fold hydrolase [Neomicrococcus lactis]